jgi:rhodanese-related sulfurtransferase
MSTNKVLLQRAHKLYNSSKGWLFLDVREQDEIVNRGTIPGAKHIPRGLLEFRIQSIANFNTPIIIFSNSTARATLSAFTLSKTLGYRKVYVLEGGFGAWKRAGYITTKQNTSKNSSKPYIKHKVLKKIRK